MEILYRKNSKGRYEEYTYGYNQDLSDGIWMVQSRKSSKSFRSLFWLVGDLKRPADITTHAALQSFNDELSNYLLKLTDENSDEFKEAKSLLGNYLKSPVGYHNISATDLCALFLRKIALNLEEGEKLDIGKVLQNFREKTHQHTKPNYDDRVKVLYEFLEYFVNNGYNLKKKM